MSAALEYEVLGQLILSPQLLESCDLLEEGLFTTPDGRKAFAGISGIYEDMRPTVIDTGILSEKTGLSQEFISNFVDGNYQPTPANFIWRVQELRRRQTSERILKLAQEEGQHLVKSGEIDEARLEELRVLFEKLGQTRRGTEDEAPLTVEELAVKQIPKIEWLVQPIVERFGYTLVGAQKGVGKSLLVTQLGLYAAAGASPFLTDAITVSKPARVLLIQQEVSLAGMQDRLLKMRAEKNFNLEERFLQLTTTGAWWNLTKKDDYGKLKRLIDKHKPDILILDPLYTFYPRELNTSGDIAPMMEVLSDLKSNYGLGLIVVHHFSNKENADDLQQRTSVGRFMGHSMIANSADTTVGLDFLHPKYRQTALPLPYQNYVCADITSRHGEWPARFAIERRQGCLLFERSSIWDNLGRSIVPGQVEDLLEANDGEMLLKDLIGQLSHEARPTTIRRAIDEAINRGSITKSKLAGRGSPVLLRSVK